MTTGEPQDFLTRREQDVLLLVEGGLSNDEIAARLGITRNAVRYHLKEIHSKLETGGQRGLLRGGVSRWRSRAGAWFAGGLAARAATSGVVGMLGLTGVGLFFAYPREQPGEYCMVRVISPEEAAELGDWRLAYTPQQSLCADSPEELDRLSREVEAAGGLPLVWPTPGPFLGYGTPPAGR
ncbi:MAG: LuxR family transcriptional regulator [Chloroflexi bacterium CFX7]|nr:LuxR family transcriptional regulator [Chloroflexi bacterium CFX7]MCL4230665.1 helix-turn-helix transcriptional regulator [Dehalococcoidia bacterium]RIL02477.1 MAG: hypothetical protein DCC78_07345 [bacterium]